MNSDFHFLNIYVLWCSFSKYLWSTYYGLGEKEHARTRRNEDRLATFVELILQLSRKTLDSNPPNLITFVIKLQRRSTQCPACLDLTQLEDHGRLPEKI